ncbi:MAG: MFS transporter [Oscillospiraceae bacterium]|nr:MFS transporter [Oscillospiraceae bacterium]
MGAEVKDSVDQSNPAAIDARAGYVYENRRYVGRKETVGYIAWDMAQSFNINSYSERFITSILKIGFSQQQVAEVIGGIWDIINDVMFATIVDKTRTRWGKFRPYLLFLAGPATIFVALYWLQPYFFPNTGTDDTVKFIFYLLLAIARETAETFRGISRGGLLATITPHPVDRTRLITVANFWSGFLGEKLPEQIMTVLIDLVGNNVIKLKSKPGSMPYLGLYSGMGVFTAIVSGFASLLFVMNTRERVMQSIERPSIMQGIRSIVNNKPVLLLTAADVLNSLKIGGGKSDYFIDVLNFASMVFFAGIPGGIVHPISYMIVPWFRRKYSSRFLYILNLSASTLSMVPVFLVGSIGGMHNGLYKKKLPMGLALAAQETFFMLFYGLGKVVPNEMYNESMDYCEWKNGYRTEAMTAVAKGLAAKLGNIMTKVLSIQLKKWFDYDQTLYSKGQKQSDKTQYFLFMQFTIIPVLTGMFQIIPIAFYDLSGKKREKMYAELLERRACMANTVTCGDVEAIANLAHEQMQTAEKNKDRKL